MKIVSRAALLVLGFTAGGLSGAFVHLGFETLEGRPASAGGEVLILPLIVLLLCLGFALGRISRDGTVEKGVWRDGYHHGYQKGQADRRVLANRAAEPPLYLDAEWRPNQRRPGR